MQKRKFRVLDAAGVMLNGKRHAKDTFVEGDLGDARLKTYLHFKQIEEEQETPADAKAETGSKKTSK